MADEKSADQRSLELLVDQLGGARRRARQDASKMIAAIAAQSPEEVAPYAEQLVDALDRPEAQTRWQALEALASIAPVDPQAAAAGVDGAEASLFDEDSAIVRLAAFKFLAALGSLSEELAEQVWPPLDEAVQCYHGDPEYRDMLTALVGFAKGKAPAEVLAALVARVGFDAQNGSGYVKQLSQEITEAAKR